METTIYILASALPALILALRVLLPAGWRFGLDLMLLVASVPVAMALIGWALKFPRNVGDHSPGIGVAFAPLALIWMCSLLVLLARLGWFVVRKSQLRAKKPGAARDHGRRLDDHKQ